MKTLVTGITGSIGSRLAPALADAGHDVRGFTRDASRAPASVHDVVEGDATSGAGLDAALDGVEVAYYLIHSMERAQAGHFDRAELEAAQRFGVAARDAGVRRIVYLGGTLPTDGHRPSRHIGSRLAVEESLLEAVPGSIAFRASIVVAANSRSFRFLVRLVERMPVLPMPAWRDNRTEPVDGRDVTAFLVAAASAPARLGGRSWDLPGPDELSYGEMISRIAELMVVGRPTLALPVSLTPIASAVASAVVGEDVALIEPLMESLETDLLARDASAAEAFGVHRHRFDAAVERALREWEQTEEIRAR
jgi:uncharacterized protein YbjT (DUF2867 family)